MEVFRDRLRPGTEETWTMQILDAAGKPADARLLATLYDASLDRLWDNRGISSWASADILLQSYRLFSQ